MAGLGEHGQAGLGNMGRGTWPGRTTVGEHGEACQWFVHFLGMFTIECEFCVCYIAVQ